MKQLVMREVQLPALTEGRRLLHRTIMGAKLCRVDRSPVIRATRDVELPCIEGNPDAEPISLRLSDFRWPLRPRILWAFGDREPWKVGSRCNRLAKRPVVPLHR